jgi:uncharacterized membrane protein
LVVGVAVSVPGTWRYGLLLGWMAGSAVFLIWMWKTIWPMDAQMTARHANREDPGIATADAAILLAAVASLGAVAFLLMSGASQNGGKDIQAALSIGSVALAWGSVHTIFTSRYARLYYTGSGGGVNFNQDDPPRYADFAYLAFTVGMTFQVSDTDIEVPLIRATILRHALLSYLFGAVIIASMINLVAGLAR